MLIFNHRWALAQELRHRVQELLEVTQQSCRYLSIVLRGRLPQRPEGSLVLSADEAKVILQGK